MTTARKSDAGVQTDGFTLLELLIIVATIAILAAIAVPNFLEAQVRGKVTRAAMDAAVLSGALEAYRADHGDYPPNYLFRAVDFPGKAQVYEEKHWGEICVDPRVSALPREMLGGTTRILEHVHLYSAPREQDVETDGVRSEDSDPYGYEYDFGYDGHAAYRPNDFRSRYYWRIPVAAGATPVEPESDELGHDEAQFVRRDSLGRQSIGFRSDQDALLSLNSFMVHVSITGDVDLGYIASYSADGFAGEPTPWVYLRVDDHSEDYLNDLDLSIAWRNEPYLLISRGPANTDPLFPEGPTGEEYAPPSYDPTNGTISPGLLYFGRQGPLK